MPCRLHRTILGFDAKTSEEVGRAQLASLGFLVLVGDSEGLVLERASRCLLQLGSGRLVQHAHILSRRLLGELRVCYVDCLGHWLDWSTEQARLVLGDGYVLCKLNETRYHLHIDSKSSWKVPFLLLN